MDTERTLPVEKRDLYLQRIAAMLTQRNRGHVTDADVTDVAKLASLAPRKVRFGSKADMCSAQADVPFVPKADIGSVWRNRQTECLSRFQVDDQIEFGGLFHRQIARVGR